MRLRMVIKRLLKPEVSGGELSEPDLDPAWDAVEQSKLALEEAQQNNVQAERIAARARQIESRNGFGQLAERLFEQERERRRQVGGHGRPA